MTSEISTWHYPRTELAEKLINSINIGLVSSFVLFAPRRIGKTEFLLYDLKPLALKNNYFVIYFNFYTDLTTTATTTKLFKQKLADSINDSFFAKVQINELKFPWCTIDLKSTKEINQLDILQLITLLRAKLEKKGMHLLLLLDEIQELEFRPEGKALIGGLRTALDLNKEFVKVIFTGSSQAGLKKMFQDSKAPFFHFSANIEFPLFDKDFTDFLAKVYKKITNKHVANNELYNIFCRLNKITWYIREILNLYVLNPNLSLEDCYNAYSTELNDTNNYKEKWLKLTVGEQSIILAIATGMPQNFYSQDFINSSSANGFIITRSSIQSALNKLKSSTTITLNNNKNYEILDTEFATWIKANITKNN